MNPSSPYIANTSTHPTDHEELWQPAWGVRTGTCKDPALRLARAARTTYYHTNETDPRDRI